MSSNKKKCAIFSCLGLGDGLITLVLANNLALNDCEVTFFHPSLASLQSWLQNVKLEKFPSPEELHYFDEIYFFYEALKPMQRLISYANDYFPEKTRILNPIATSRKNIEHYNEGKFNTSKTFVCNIANYCKTALQLKNVVLENGITLPLLSALTHRKFQNRVILHPMSAKESKNWPIRKYISLAKKMKKKGYDPVFIMTKKENRLFPEIKGPKFSSLSELASFVYESGYFIGNDSGVGHLASCLGIETVTVCRSKRIAQFWRPGWANGVVVSPPKWIPNGKGFRWRDQQWKKWISVSRVFRGFKSLL